MPSLAERSRPALTSFADVFLTADGAQSRDDELLALRAELARVSRLVRVSQLMVSVAHDVRRPLTAILSHAAAAARALEGGPEHPHAGELRERLSDIAAEGRLAANVVDRLRALSLEKPIVESELCETARRPLERRASSADDASTEAFFRRVGSLTVRERDVLACLVDGLMNKQIAAKLGIAEKTVKIHRGRIMRKMSVRSVVELARLTERFGLPRPA